MAEDGSFDVGALSPVWTAGWQWPWVVVLAFMLGGNFVLADRVLFGGAVLVGGPLLALAGVRAVNRAGDDVLADGTEHVRRAARDATEAECGSDEFDGRGTAVADAGEGRGDAPVVYTLTADAESVVGIDPPKRCALTTVLLGEDRLVVHPDARVDVFNAGYELGDRTETVRYDRIVSVDYVEPAAADDADNADGVLRVTRTGGDERTYRSSAVPEDVLAAIRRRIAAA